MTLISVAKSIATNIGIAQPDSVQGTDPNALKIVQFVNETGVELARRVDWTLLNKRHSIMGDGTDRLYDLAEDHMRMALGMAVSVASAPVRGGVSADEWFSLTPVAGTPRYFRLTGQKIGFYPYPNTTVTVSYQSKNWGLATTGDGTDAMSKDTDIALVPEDLLTRGAIWRWYRHVGRDFSDYMAEYEGMLTDLAQAEGGIRQP